MINTHGKCLTEAHLMNTQNLFSWGKKNHNYLDMSLIGIYMYGKSFGSQEGIGMCLMPVSVLHSVLKFVFFVCFFFVFFFVKVYGDSCISHKLLNLFR